jgi:hypothetical protein
MKGWSIMAPKWHLALGTFVIVIAISACGSPSTQADNLTQPVPTSETITTPELPSASGDSSYFGLQTQWPSYIPDDIPALEGKIRLVMEAPGSHVRIFYEDLSRDQLDQYLKLLKQKGFQLEYTVYVQEGFPDNSEERLKRGDFDAVDITKGAFHMRLEYGENSATYDIYSSGFEIPNGVENLAQAPDSGFWPTELNLIIPQPERCPIVSVDPIPPQDYRITCRPGDKDVADDYKRALQAAGFMPNDMLRASDGSLDGSIYAWGSWEISVDQPSSALILITISNTTSKKSNWPSELMGIVPQPEGCLVTSVTNLGDAGFSILCEGEGEQIRLDYIDLLLSGGFVEASQMESQNGELISMKLDKEDLHVELLLGSFPGMVINISRKP